ncbi:MaoC/PaaZ C-terminal domain-containing protein [Kitasatospora sp. NPDC048239]|uniref:MaoC/PaaZ C-terminal domain-containing protein n=1 Tax=Kitasatospora sp. NPDC048239 TaxID=3364046 RepID=UPI00371EE776
MTTTTTPHTEPAPAPATATAPAAAPDTGPRTARRTVTAGELAEYRACARTGLPPARDGAPSPVHPFVLAHTLAEHTVTALTAHESAPVAVVHLGQEIRTTRPVRAGEHVTTHLTVLGARREARGTRLALRTRLSADDTVFAELLTSALLLGARTIEPFGDIPPAPVPGTTPGEPATTLRTLDTAAVHRYAHASGDLNPIHLDDQAARAAGFPAAIAHGMSLLALAAEEIADRYADGDATRISGLGARFAAPVTPGTALHLRLHPHDDAAVVRFTLTTDTGAAVKAGWATLTPPRKDAR